jgi:NAD(P)-dependent dehydrogenase (short-subunit alcohol dehydrogenase family)
LSNDNRAVAVPHGGALAQALRDGVLRQALGLVPTFSSTKKAKESTMDQSCIVVTGASRGIGAAIAHRLASAGRYVACVSRSGGMPHRDASPETISRWIPIQADVTDVTSLREAYEKIIGRGLRVTGLVNNAGIYLEGPSADVSADHWREVIDTNATAVFTSCQVAYPALLAAGGGLIVNMGSFFDKLGVRRSAAYCASKAAVGAITRCLAVEWAAKGIRVIDVAPGYIQTDLNAKALGQGPLRAYLETRIPSGSPGTPDDVASLVGSLFSDGGRFLTGETIYIDGAQGIAH